MNLHSIRVRIAALSALCVVLAVGSMVGYGLYTSLQTKTFVTESVESLLDKKGKDQLQEIAAAQAGLIRSELDTAFAAARNMARMLEVMASDPAKSGTPLAQRRDQLNDVLMSVLKDNPRFNGTYSAWEPNGLDNADQQYRGKREVGSDDTGRALPYWTRSGDGHIDIQPLVEYDSTDLHPNGVMKGAWYLNPKAGKGESILDPLPYIVQGKNVYLATMSVPITIDGKFRGVAGADFDLAFVQKLANDVASRIYSAKATVTIVSYKGLIVASSEKPDLIGKGVDSLGRDLASDLQSVQSGKSTVMDAAGTQSIEVFSPIHLGKTSTPWSVLISVPRAVVLAEAGKLGAEMADRSKTDTTWQLITGAGIAVLSLAFLAFMAHGIVRPIEALTGALRSIAAGHFNEEVTGRDRKDEIGEIARAVEDIRDSTVERARIEAEGKETEARAAAEKRKADMNSLADRFESTVGTIITSVSSASGQLETAATSLTKTAETTEHLSTTVAAASEQTSANVQGVAAAAQELAATVTEISRQTLEASSIAKDAVDQAEITNSRVNELSQSADRIGAVVGMINSIASQTNLLALNATIEAARAGDAGKGFAVVAQEVKTLAAQTGKATDEIAEQISSMQTATLEAVRAIEGITVTIGKISEISATIAAAVEQQGATTAEITRNVTDAARGTSEVASSITTVNRGANETGISSSNVLSSAQLLSKESDALRREVNHFLDTVRAA